MVVVPAAVTKVVHCAAKRGKSRLCIKHGDSAKSELLNLKEIDGQIGADAGEESDMTASEFESKDIISKHIRSPRFDMQMVDCVDNEIPQASSSFGRMSSIESSSDLGKQNVNTKYCRFPGCIKEASGACGCCVAHGGGIRCQKSGCIKGAEGRTIFCKAHGVGRRCEYLGCTMSVKGRTDFCITHGGGRLCNLQGCSRPADGRSWLCVKHGGKRCTRENCFRSAESNSGLCINHGGERRCLYGLCKNGALGNTQFCRAHGGKRCIVSGCTKSATEHTNDYCGFHGGASTCKFAGCTKIADCSTDFCSEHAEPKRCTWGMVELSLAVGDHRCDKLVESEIGLCAAHSAEIQGHSDHGGGASRSVSVHQKIATDVRPDAIVGVATPKGDQETKTFIEAQAHVVPG